MALSIQLDKTWVIECMGDLGSRSVRGGICVMKRGIILTSWFDLTRNNLRGRNHGSDIWFKLKIVKEKPNFGLALLKVEKVLKPKEKSSVGLRFSSFNLKKHMKKKVDLKRGDVVQGVFHREDNPFTSFFGYSCCPFRVEDVEFPSMESMVDLSETGDAREEVFTSPIPYLCTKHIITVLPSRDKHVGNGDDDDICYSGDDKDDGSDNIGGGVCRDDKDAGNDNISESDNDFDSDSDADDEYDLERLHPGIPLIQVHGLGSGLGSHGCPVFKHKNIIGMFYFTSSGYQYVLSISFLYAFLSHLISSRKKRRLLRKRTRKVSVSKPTKRQKLDSASAAPPSENPGVQRPKTPQSDASEQPQAGQTSVALGLLKVHCAPLNCAGSKLDALDGTALYYAAGCRRQERVLFLNKTSVADVTALAKRHADGSLPIEDYNIQLDEQRGHLMESETDQGAIKMDLMPHTKVKELISAQRFDALEVLDMEEPQVSDETWSLEDVECAVNIFKEAKDNKAEKLADDQKCQVEIMEQKCGKTLLAKADDMQKLDPLVSNSFENVDAEALWRHKNDALKALDDLTNRVTKSKIQLDLKSVKRRRHQGHVEARVSQLVSMGFDTSRALNSPGTARKAFGELLEKDVMTIAAVCEHTRCAEPTAASLNSVDSDGERPSTFADGNDSCRLLLQMGMPSALDVFNPSRHSPVLTQLDI